MRWFQLVVASWMVASCSHPAAPPQKHRPNPDDTPDAPATGPILFRYDWEARRAHYEKRTAGPWYESPCLKSHASRATQDLFAYPKGPDDMAALVTSLYIREEGGTLVVLDRGRSNGVDESWSAVLLDDDGHAVTEWTCVQMRGEETTIVVPRPRYAVERFKHAALFQDPPPLKKPR
jgi:hypothetical protein